MLNIGQTCLGFTTIDDRISDLRRAKPTLDTQRSVDDSSEHLEERNACPTLCELVFGSQWDANVRRVTGGVEWVHPRHFHENNEDTFPLDAFVPNSKACW